MPIPADPIARLLALGGELAPPLPGEQGGEGPRRKFDLAHMRTLLQALGNPQEKFPSVLIAGTNGKGSTAATLASIFQAAGYRTGLFTSPHLERPNERIRIGGAAISDQDLSARFEQVEAAFTHLTASGRLPHPPSFFEAITAIAFLYFAAAGNAGQPEAGEPVDIAVLEVGLGGRLDATNVVSPLLSVITDISLDHQNWLGNTIAAITREKAGILRPGGALVTLPQHPEANQAIGEAAVPLGVNAISAAPYLPARAQPGAGLPRTLKNRYDLLLPDDVLGAPVLHVDSPLLGEHQQRNIALAIAAAVFLHQNCGFSLSARAVEQGILETSWPGRLQFLYPPTSLANIAPVLLDAAHNPAGAWTLRAALSSLPLKSAGTPRTLVFACMQDKAVDELAQILFPVMDSVFLTQAASPRASSLERLAQAAEPTGTPYRLFSQARQALDAALTSTPASGLVVIAGSVVLLGECLAQLQGWHTEQTVEIVPRGTI